MKAWIKARRAAEREAQAELHESPDRTARELREAGFVRDADGRVCRVVRKFAMVEDRGGVKQPRLVERVTRWNETTALLRAARGEPAADVARRPGRRQAGPRSGDGRVIARRRRRPLWLALAEASHG